MDSTSDVVLDLTPVLIKYTSAESMAVLQSAIMFAQREQPSNLAADATLTWWAELFAVAQTRRSYLAGQD